MSTPAFNFTKALDELTSITEWFQNAEIDDLDEMLLKLKRGKELYIACKKRFVAVENEFIQIKADFEKENDTLSAQPTPQTSLLEDSGELPF